MMIWASGSSTKRSLATASHDATARSSQITAIQIFKLDSLLSSRRKQALHRVEAVLLRSVALLGENKIPLASL